MDKPIYICDTNVFLSALLSHKSPPNKAIRYLLLNSTLAFSEHTLAELEEVFSRDKFDKFISKQARNDFLSKIKASATLYEIHHSVTICRDPKDNKFLDVAIASYADYIITGDEDLLILKNIGNTSIISPRDFIEIFCENF